MAQNVPVDVILTPESPANTVPDFPLFPELESFSFNFQDQLDGIYIGLSDDDGRDLAADTTGLAACMDTASDSSFHQSNSKPVGCMPGTESHHVPETGTSDTHLPSPRPRTPQCLCLCVGPAFSALQEMYRAESTCRREKGSALPSSDQILKVNRAAVQSVDQLLSRGCAACLGDISILLLVTTVISKVLAWYQAVFNRIAQPSPAKSPVDLVEPISVTPIHFGDFRLDLVAEQRITAQLLLCELHNVLILTGLLRESALCRIDNGHAQIGSLLGAICEFLSSTLNNLTSRVDGFCVSKPSTTPF
ncbi:hypothetical protein BBP40_003273 [Aspergillus hancockii]|nr:hypothetical protein BBP40_003273 [Aspergillus hancockii]